MTQLEDFLAKARQAGQAINQLAQTSPTLAGHAAFKLFCTPRRLAVREQDRRFLGAAQQQTVELAGIPIHTYTWPAAQPDAPVVLFLHGWESSSARWQRFLRPVREAGFTMTAFDAPGQGQSGGEMLNLLIYSRIVKNFFETVGKPYAVVGHSLGGAAAMMSMGLLDAPAVHKAVLMGTFAESSRIVDEFGSLLGLEPRVLEAVREEIRRLSGLPIEEYSVVKAAAKLLHIPGLVVHDQQDIVAPIGEGRAIAHAWGAELLETHGLGHGLQDKQVVEAVVRFMTD